MDASLWFYSKDAYASQPRPYLKVTYTPPENVGAGAEIYLENGWNLVCFPVVNENTKPENVFAGLVYGVDYVLKYWVAPGGPYRTQFPDQVLENDRGYWVSIKRDYTVTVP